MYQPGLVPHTKDWRPIHETEPGKKIHKTGFEICIPTGPATQRRWEIPYDQHPSRPVPVQPPPFCGQVWPWHISTLHRQPFRERSTCCKLSVWHSHNKIFRRRTSTQLRVLKKFSAPALWVRLDKCKFMAPSVTYLGHRIDLEGLHSTEDKIRAIRDAPAPRNAIELKAFRGLFQFYSRYVSNFVDKLGSLYWLLRKGVSLRWETDHSLAFQQAKGSLQTNGVLVYYVAKKELLVMLVSTACEQF